MTKKTIAFRFILSSLLASLLSGCVSVSGIADSFSTAILNQSDPDTVRDGLPAYLIFLDAMVQDNPGDAALIAATAKLYSAYAGSFVEDAKRAQGMSSKAIKYAKQALCLEQKKVCQFLSKPLDQYEAAIIASNSKKDLAMLYTLGSVWAGWIQANSGDWQAIADLPKVEATMKHVLALDERYENGSAHLYMGVLLTLRPAALGGQPDKGREHFERAIELSAGKNLMAKVLYARNYARLVFDQELHDRLLNEVLSADAEAEGFTLINALAKKQAEALLAESSDYF